MKRSALKRTKGLKRSLQVERTCAADACANTFTVRPLSSQRFCSTSCGAAQPRPERRAERVARRCANPACGRVFEPKPSEVARGGGKFCSRSCWAAAPPKRSAEGRAAVQAVGRARKGAANPNYRHGRRAGMRDRAGEARWYPAKKDHCEHPLCPAPHGSGLGLDLHHIVYRQHVRREGGDEWDPRNALTLCDRCHTSHHRRGRIIPTAILPTVALDFAFELLGPAAYDYLVRRYGVPDDRLLRRLQDAEAAA